MINKLIRYFKGWVEFELTGNFLSDFLQELSKNNIIIWDIIKTDKKIFIKTYIRNYKYISRIASKTKNRVRISKKYGFHFKKYKYRKRHGLIFGLITFCFLIIFSQSFIWEIKFPEYDVHKLDYLKHEMKQHGIKIGSYYRNLDFKEIQQKILQKDKNLSRISFNRKGTTIEVEISPRDKNDFLNDKAPCNIVADKTAQIVSIDNYSGVKQVKPQQIVMIGDILINGKQITEDGGYKAVHADGKIIANTYFDHTISFSYNQKEKIFNEEISRYSLDILGLKIPLYIDFKINRNFEKETKEKNLKLFGIKLPINIVCDKYKTYDLVDKIYSEQEAIEEIEKSFNQYEEKELHNSKIIEKKDIIDKTNDKISVTRKYIVQEEIGKKDLLFINE